jgi:hypothetical protein
MTVKRAMLMLLFAAYGGFLPACGVKLFTADWWLLETTTFLIISAKHTAKLIWKMRNVNENRSVNHDTGAENRNASSSIKK